LLTLFRRADFDADNVRLMETFASQAAIAVDHAQLTRMVQEMAILEERHRLSRELHDSVNQLLYGISLYTEAALRQMDQGNLEAARRYLKNIEESDQAALKEMRMLIFGLRPSGLAQMGLQASLAQRLKSVEEKLGLQPSFKWRVLSPLETEVEEVLYGIAQEALNNVIRHANARAVSVRIAESDRLITMTIKDDGDGFDPNSVTSGGMGLKTMRERAAVLNARLRIESQPGQGTQVKVEVAR
jgi:signal transduction histidine kinase